MSNRIPLVLDDGGNTEQLQTGDVLMVGELYVHEGDSSSPGHIGISVSRTMIGSSINQDNIRDTSTLHPTGAGAMFCSYDASVTALGSYQYEHIAGYQERVIISGDANCNNIWGFYSLPTLNGAGTLINRYGVIIHDVGGSGALTHNYGIYIDSLVRGGTDNYAIYSAGSTPSHFGGSITCNGITNSALGSNEVVYTTAGGALATSSNLQFGTYLLVNSSTEFPIVATGGVIFGNFRFTAIGLGENLGAGTSGEFGYMTHQTDNTQSGLFFTNYGETEGTTGFFVKRGGNIGVGTLSPTARLHLASGLALANFAPLKLTSGSLIPTTAEPGAIEFLTDNLYFTITTGSGFGVTSTRKNIALCDKALTSGRVPYATTNGRLTDNATLTYDTTNNALLTVFIHGEMYATNIAQTVTIVTIDVPVEVNAGLSDGSLNGVTMPNDYQLKVNVAGTYLINWSMSVESAATSARECEGGIMINGTYQNNGTAHSEVSVSGHNRPETIGATGMYKIPLNGTISLALSNHSDVSDIILQHASLTALRIGS